MFEIYWLVFGLGMLVALWVFQGQHRKGIFAPGPRQIPFLGNIFQIAAQSPFPSVAFQKLSKIYGDVLSVKLGVVDALVFNSADSVQEIMNHEKGSLRASSMIPMIHERVYGKNLGIIFGNGEPWANMRRFSIRTLREFGFGKAASMDSVIGEELTKFLEYLETKIRTNSGGAVEVTGLFDLTLVNILWRLVTGINYSMDDQRIARLLNLSNELMSMSKFSVDISAAFPFLWHWFPNWFGKNKQMKIIEELRSFFRETLETHRRNGDFVDNPQSYVDVFLQKIEQNADPEYNDDQLVICLFDLFQAGSETCNRTMSFGILYMLLYQDIQHKVQKELDEVLENGMIITTDKRARLPYTHATLLEILRFSSVVPFTPPRKAPEDFYFRKYLIKKGTVLMPNLEAVHFSNEVWGDAQSFRPERFLNKEETAVDMNLSSKLVAFGGGKRICSGQNLAEAMMFMYFASILKRFKLVKDAEDEEPSIIPMQGITYSPQPFRVKFVERK